MKCVAKIYMKNGAKMFRDEELNPILAKNNWEELTLKEQNEVKREFTIEYVSTSKGVFNPIYLTTEEKDYEVKFFNIHNNTFAKTVHNPHEARRVILEQYKKSNGVE